MKTLASSFSMHRCQILPDPLPRHASSGTAGTGGGSVENRSQNPSIGRRPSIRVIQHRRLQSPMSMLAYDPSVVTLRVGAKRQ